MVGLFGVVGIVIALVNAAKEKFGFAIAGLLFWPAGVVSAFRLAKPRSAWAHWFYREGRLGRSRERYRRAAPARAPRRPAPARRPATDGHSSS